MCTAMQRPGYRPNNPHVNAPLDSFEGCKIFDLREVSLWLLISENKQKTHFLFLGLWKQNPSLQLAHVLDICLMSGTRADANAIQMQHSANHVHLGTPKCRECTAETRLETYFLEIEVGQLWFPKTYWDLVFYAKNSKRRALILLKQQ